MNLSASAVEESDGEKAEERPDYAEELRRDRQVGYQQGSPVVGDRLKLDEDPADGYGHYLTRRDLFLPKAGDFLAALFDSELITSVEDAAEEIRTDEDDVRQAVKIHGLDLPDGDGEDRESDRDGSELVLPNGESWPLDVLENPAETDVRVLTQLISQDGLSVDETVVYLSDQLNRDVDREDVHRNAKRGGLL